jgi:hypothetical protein
VVEQLRIDNVTVTGVAQGVITVSGDVNREATSVLAVTGLAPKSEVHYKFNHSFTLALLASGNYAYQLVVTDKQGETASATGSFIVGVVPDTMKPTMFVGAKPASQTALTVDWQSTEELIDPVVYFGADAQHLTQTKNAVSALSGTVTLSSLTPGTSYTVQLRGRDRAGNASESNLAQASTLVQPPLPVPFVVAYAETISSDSVVIRWRSSVELASPVRFDWTCSCTVTHVPVSATGGFSGSFSVTGLESAKLHTFNFFGTTTLGQQFADTGTFTTDTFVPPVVDTTPPWLSVGKIGTPTTTSAEVLVVASEMVQSFVFRYGTAPGTLNQSLGGTQGTFARMSLSGLAPGTTYYYEVAGTDLAGNASVPASNGTDRGHFTTWAVATGRYQWSCVTGVRVRVYYQETDFFEEGISVSRTPQQTCATPLVDIPSGDKMHATCDGVSASNVRGFKPSGEPIVNPATGLPILPFSTAVGYRDRVRADKAMLGCVDVGYP